MDSMRVGGGSRYDGFHSGINSKQSSPLRSNHCSYNNTTRLRQSLNIQRINQPILFNPSHIKEERKDQTKYYQRANHSYIESCGKNSQNPKRGVTSPNTCCNTSKNYEYLVFGSPETIDVVQNQQQRKYEEAEEDCYQIEQESNLIKFRNSCDKQEFDLESHHIPKQFQSRSPKEMSQYEQKSTAIDTDRRLQHSLQNRSASAVENIKHTIKNAPNSVPNRQLFSSLRYKSSTPFMFGAKKEKSMLMFERNLNENSSKNQSSSKISTGAEMEIQLQNQRQRTQSQYFIGNHNSISSEQMLIRHYQQKMGQSNQIQRNQQATFRQLQQTARSNNYKTKSLNKQHQQQHISITDRGTTSKNQLQGSSLIQPLLDCPSPTEMRSSTSHPLVRDLSPKEDQASLSRFSIKKTNPGCDIHLQSAAPKNLRELQIVQVIGKGGFSTVHAVRSKKDGRLFAMKSVRKQKVVKHPQQIQRTATEQKIHLSIQHPFLIHTYSIFQSKFYFHVLMQFCPGGELFYHLNKHRPFPQSAAKFYFSEVVLAIEYLHQHDIVYRDLKPQNILLDIDGHTKLTDFGLSKNNFTKKSRSHSICGSPEYMPPEMLATREHSRTVDFYALGAFLYQMLYGVPPYYSTDRGEMYRNILEGNLIFPKAKQSISGYFKKSNLYKSTEVSQSAKSLMRLLLNKEANQRLGSHYGVSQLKQHLFCSDINWDQVRRRKYQPPIKPDFTLSNFDKEYTELPARLSLQGKQRLLNINREYEMMRRQQESQCCNAGDPDYIDLQLSGLENSSSLMREERGNKSANYQNTVEGSSQTVASSFKRQSSPVFSGNKSKPRNDNMASYYKKQKLHSRNKTKNGQFQLTVQRTEKQLVSDSKKKIIQEEYLSLNNAENYQRQRTISDPLNTSMLQHEIEEAVRVTNNRSQKQSQLNRDNSISLNQNLNTCNNKNNNKSHDNNNDNNDDNTNLCTNTTSPMNRNQLKITTNPSSKMLMSFGSPQMKNAMNSKIQNNNSQKQQLFSTVQQQSTTLTAGLTAQRQSGICLSNISSNNHISQGISATTYETEHSSDNGSIIIIGDRSTLNFPKLQSKKPKRTNKSNIKSSQFTSAEKQQQDGFLTNKSSKPSNSPYERIGRVFEENKNYSKNKKSACVIDFTSHVNFIEESKNQSLEEPKNKVVYNHISRQGSFQGLDLDGNKTIPQQFYTSNNTPISRDNPCKANNYQKFSKNYVQKQQKSLKKNHKNLQSAINFGCKNKKSQGMATTTSNQNAILGSVLLPYQQNLKMRKENQLKSGNRRVSRMDIHNIVSERKREPLSPQPLPMMGQYEQDLCVFQTSYDVEDGAKKIPSFKFQNQEQKRSNFRNKLYHYQINGRSQNHLSDKKNNISCRSSTLLEETVHIKAFQHQKNNKEVDIQDLYAEKILRDIKRDFNLKGQQNGNSFSQELSQYFQSTHNKKLEGEGGQEEEQQQLYKAQKMHNAKAALFQSSNQREFKEEMIINSSRLPKYPRNQLQFDTVGDVVIKKRKGNLNKKPHLVSRQKKLRASSSSQSNYQIQSSHNISKSIDNPSSNNASITVSPVPEMGQKQLKKEIMQGCKTSSSNITTPIHRNSKIQCLSREISSERQPHEIIRQKIASNITSKIKNKQQQQHMWNKKIVSKNQKIVSQHQTKTINQSVSFLGQKQKRQKYMQPQSFTIAIKSEETKKGGFLVYNCEEQTPTNKVNNAVYNTASFKLGSSPPDSSVPYAQSGNITTKNRSPLNRSPVQSISSIINSHKNPKNQTCSNFNTRSRQDQNSGYATLKQVLGGQMKRSKYIQKQINKEAKRKSAIAQKILLRESSSHAIKHYKPQKFQNKSQKQESKIKSKTSSSTQIYPSKNQKQEEMILKQTLYFPQDKQNYRILRQHQGDSSKVNSTQGTNNMSSTSQQATVGEISTSMMGTQREETSAAKRSELKRIKYEKKKIYNNKPKSATHQNQGAFLFHNNEYQSRKQGESQSSRDISSSRKMKFSKYLTHMPDLF